ncbi:MAG: hypothetical protein ACTHOL_17650 [Luteibacter jiangsuensis]
MTSDDQDLARLLAGADIDTPDPRFVERTHRVIAVEALARLETTNAWKACVRDLVIAATLVGGMVVASLVLLHHTSDSMLVAPLALGIAFWAMLHDWSLPSFDGAPHGRPDDANSLNAPAAARPNGDARG